MPNLMKRDTPVDKYHRLLASWWTVKLVSLGMHLVLITLTNSFP